MSEYKKLYRSKTDRMVAGICGGIAEYFNQDPTLIRILFVILGLLSGTGIILYIIGWIIIPEETSNTKSKDENHAKEEFSQKISQAAQSIKEDLKSNPRRIHGDQIFGLVILFIGLSILFNNFLPWLHFGRFWLPILLILIGFAIIFNRKRG